MISWIQTTFKHHIKAVFAILLFAMAIPLVFVYSTSGGIGRADRSIRERTVFGKPFTTESERREFMLDGQISLQLTSGTPYFSEEQAEYFAFVRAAKLSLADEFRIPVPTDQQLTEFIKTLPTFRGPDGNYDPQAYARFLDNTRGNPIYSQSRISRILQEDWRAEKANEVISGPGFALDPEIRDQLALVDSMLTVHRATMPVKDIKADGEPTEAELQQWFDMNAARYRNPPAVQVSVVDFPAEQYASRVPPPTDDDIVKYFEANKANYAPAPKEGEDQAVVGEAKLEDVRDRVVQDLVQQRAINAAVKAASDFAYTLFDKGITRDTPAFEAVLRDFGTTFRSMPPLPVSQQTAGSPLVREAMTLSPDKPVSDPVIAGNVAFVLFFDGRQEASDALFSAVRERVLADVQEDRRVRAVVARGEEMRAKLEAAVKAGTPFPEAAKSAGLEVTSWENFTRRTMPDDFDRSILNRIEDQPVGAVSPMTVQGDQGSFLLVAQRREPVVTLGDPNYQEAREVIMQQSGRIAAQMTLVAMVQAERIAVGLDRPADNAAQ